MPHIDEPKDRIGEFYDSPTNTRNPWPDGTRAVCKRCHAVMRDLEPSGSPEYWHPSDRDCQNKGRTFTPRDPDFLKELEPYRRKRERRAMTRTQKKYPRR